MISQTAEYALRAVVFLAENAQAGQTTEYISRATKVPNAYLSKVLQQLSRAGIVQAQRGIKGGFRLLRKPADITVLEVVNAVDPVMRIKECPLGLPAHATKLCSLHRRIDEATALFERAFANTTIADLLADTNADNVYTFPFQTTEAKPSAKESS
jgi:Rrf2 family protein